MKSLFLNSDNSLNLNINDDGSYNLIADHSNIANSKRLVQNIKENLEIKKTSKKTKIYLFNILFATIYKNGIIEQKNKLTSFETRFLSQNKKLIGNINRNPINVKLSTDLHTHFAGALSPSQLIKLGLNKEIYFDTKILNKIGIDTKNLNTNEKGQILLNDFITIDSNRKLLENAMKIDTSEQETFNKMEEIYLVRNAFTKNPTMFEPMIKEIAYDCKETGVNYIELSLASVISNVNQIKLFETLLPELEKETGVKIRFLGAMWRHSDKEWNNDEVDRLKITSKSPYIVGSDFMGHETNPTVDFYDNLYDLAKNSILQDPEFVVRVHAGENPLFKANVRQSLLAVYNAHKDLEQETGKTLPYPQIRIGHGLYGFDEPAPWDEPDITKDISTLELCKLTNTIIEFNLTSNLSLNNIDGLNQIPIKEYLNNDIRVVLATDGKGIYSTSIAQETILATQLGLDANDLAKIKQTEQEIISKQNQRFKKFKDTTIEQIEKELETCYKFGKPQYTKEVEDKYKQELNNLQARLKDLIKDSKAETDKEKIKEATKDKTPILITGASAKSWPKMSLENQQKIRDLFYAMSYILNPSTTYLITGGTNHGVEKEAHIIFDERNKSLPEKMVVLGTLTEEAATTENNSVEANTITHAEIASINNRPAKRWFDLPDAVLNMVGEKNGIVMAVGGGPIVNDMIQRSHNMGLNLTMLSGVEGASGTKSIALADNGYDFANLKEFYQKIKAINPNLIREGIEESFIDKIEEIIYNKHVEEKNMATLKLYSLDKEIYPDIEIKCKEIKDMSKYATNLLEVLKLEGKTPKKAKKTALVTARLGVVGEQVDTRPRVKRDGKVYVIGETKGTVKVEGSMVVKNPDGEEYIIKPDKFASKYKQTNTPGIYESISEPITYIISEQDIAFDAPWGEKMFAVKGASLNISSLEDIYAIQNEAFEKTYSNYNPVKTNAQVQD